MFNLVEGLYEEEKFQGDEAIASSLLSALRPESPLTVAQVLQG